ncbi:PspC domain-containing protein [Alkalihalobacillus sp. CinArs1]|uniref:PspC domain-containing protein n=1 Tax=Alkalihalobacillus sp. CinArs1 TaxID=2995314 RepID=UPI0022DDA7BC|nr:PspC domain-containing protein [Alkalihalobacillus sp. CinArs1]
MKKLYKSTQDRKLSGVLGGLSEVWNMDASMLRIVFAVLTVLLVGLPMVLIYVVAALILPDDKDVWE